MEEWKEIKQKLQKERDDCHVLSLPCLKDGDKYFSESQAIPYYIALKTKNEQLFGSNDDDKVRCMQLKGVLLDFISKKNEIYKSEDYEKVHKDNLEYLKSKFCQLNNFVGDKDFFMGYLTYIDIVFSYFYLVFSNFVKNSESEPYLDEYENLNRVKTNVQNLDGIKEYLESDEYKKRPFIIPNYLKVPVEYFN